MDARAAGAREQASLFDGGVVVAATVITGVVFFGMVAETIRVFFGLTRDVDGPSFFVFYNGVMGVWFVQLLARVIRRDFAWPTGWRLAANLLDSFARGWGIGLAVGDARLLADALAHFGGPNINGSLLADALFFAVGTLWLVTPALVALWLARRVT